MKIRTIGIVFLLLIISSCSSRKKEEKSYIRPVKVVTVESRSEIKRNFSGIVEAVNFVKLAFRVSGQIINLPVVEGQRIQKGDLIAEIDPRDIALQYAADKAAYETATSQLERNKRLLEKQAISQQEYEISEANYQRGKSSYDLSANNMRDTHLYAPFSGSVEKKLAENYQRVTSGVPIIQLINTNDLQIRTTFPDNNLYLLQGSSEKEFQVEFETYKGILFKAKLKEYLDASPDGSGIPVTITIDDPAFDLNKYDVKPGFTCNIHFYVKLDKFIKEGMTWIPLSAIFSDTQNKETCVWVVDSSNTVRRRPIEVYTPTGENAALVTKGLNPGEKIITAGIYQIIEGEKVRVIQ